LEELSREVGEYCKRDKQGTVDENRIDRGSSERKTLNLQKEKDM
jgi:hypothetical protein